MNWQHVILVCEIYVILALGSNLTTGYLGMLSFAHAAFFGIGAYVTAILTKRFETGFVIALVASALVCTAASLPLSWFTLRLKGLYWVLATIAFQITVYSILFNWEAVTGGSHGIGGIPFPVIFGREMNTTSELALVGGLLLLLVVSFCYGLSKTHFTTVLECFRDNEIGAISLGKDPFFYRLMSISISAAIVGVGGGFFASTNGYIDASSFTLSESILIVSMILIGGTGNLIGPICGACFYVLLPEAIRLIPINDAQGASLQAVVYALVLVLVVRFRPNGMFGKYVFR